MAGLRGLKILLLLAGIVALTNCQTNDTKAATAAKPPTPAPTPTPTLSSTKPVSSNQTLPSTSVSVTKTTTAPKPTLTSTTKSDNSQGSSGTNPTSSASSPTRTTTNSPSLSVTSSPTVTKAAPAANHSDPSATAPTPPLTLSTLKPSNQTLSSASVSATTLPPSISNQSSPTTTSVTNQTVSQATTTVPPPQCSYNVTPIKFGFRFNITSSAAGNYTITINEEGQSTTSLQLSDQTKSHEIKQLKPCTEYEHHVTFTVGPDKIKCINSDGHKTKTSEMNKVDIKVSSRSCKPGYVCYQSDWNIGSSLSTPNNIPAHRCDKKTFCVKPGSNDICSDFTTSFTCGNFSITKSITVDFLDETTINQPIPTELPAKINPELPPNCKNLSIDYTCQENRNPAEQKKLSELEPYTDYSCTGLIKNNNVPIKVTTAIKFNIDCELTITNTKNSTTNTSIELRWNTASQKCRNVLSNLKKLSYECSCRPTDSNQKGKTHEETNGGRCKISGLKPYTNYTCDIQPTYNNKKVNKQPEVKLETDPGRPDQITKLNVNVSEHNVIKVTCDRAKNLNGPEERYIIRLRYAGGTDVVASQNGPKCNTEFKDLSYLTKYTVEVTVFNGIFESEPMRKDVSTLYNDKAVIGFLVFLIIITFVALLFVSYKIYILKRRKSHDLSENIGLISTANDEENLLPIEPIVAEVLLETYKRKLADEGRLFLAEFQSIPRIFSRYTVKEAKKPNNSVKNRYVDILPYDYNRVQLTTGNGDQGCDYINASFIDGYKESKKYIAAQGPKDESVTDFWRMVWEQQSSIIVMVTRCEEGNRTKCAQYWPSPQRETEIFEEFIVKLSSENHCPDYTIRHLSLTNKKEKNSEREVTHIQFMSWPDHGVPEDPHLLLKLRRRVNAFKNFFSGPIVIHCSAGVGRTGTYIGIDAMMECLEAEGRVDIYGYVVRLRRQRCLMVQVESQYILIHQALVEHNQFGESEIALSELHSAVNSLKQKSSDSEPSLLEEEFERLPTFKTWRTFNTGITEENIKKNRSSSVIPYDYNRVLLKIDEGYSHDSDHDENDEEESSDEEDEESTKYINASYIDGYWGPRAFIVAQTPLPDTMADFWLMVYQKKASTIVMLSECSVGDMESDCVYWGNDKKVFGDFEVEVVNTDTSPTFICRTMLIHHVKRKDSRQVKHFQFLKWVKREVPENPQDFIDMIKNIRSGCKSERGMSIVVHCNNGSSRSGVFCALWNLLDSAEIEKLVDVFQVTKTLRKERQAMLFNLAQYQFLYEALEAACPVQNGEVKAVQAPAVDSVQIVNETKAAEQPAEAKEDKPTTTTSNDQQGTAENTPLVAAAEEEDKKEEPEKDSSAPTETTPLEDTSNGPAVTVDA
ncbi:receptor-type tyrosine-protein phosphatase C isoform X5 [Mastacembelus armatus]|uniref:receptor-type tyrosine-protein phosphatase C isoform X5 n=1 Tax=Mastacembelus armatus TaxID=205130 RepID=UPI000E45FFEA|nr:receptor-type tyrosine-protein phosphatase C isoform X5 [Mastacembelus armatus]